MLDHKAIRRAYPNAWIVDDGTGAFDKDGNKIVLEQTKIDSARADLDKEAAAIKYKADRKENYPSFADQFDLIYHSGIDAWKAKIKETKDKYPKPS